MQVLNRTEIDGIPTVWSPVPGPLRASLTVRVGSADETYVTSGISHLLEHLALFGLGRPGDHSNGCVNQTWMSFQAVGDDGEVRDFLGALTRQLVDPPFSRLEAERGVLKVEEAGRHGGAFAALNVWRYGAVGYGLMAQNQYGAQQVTPEQLTAWSRRFATRGNSVLWLSGPPPAGLRLHLPDGPFRPEPDPRVSILPATPAWFCGSDGGAAMSAIVPRGYPSAALAGVLRGRLVDELRTRRAVAYSPQVDSGPLTGEVSHLLAATDLMPDRDHEAVRAFLKLLESLASEAETGDSVREDELAHWVAQRRRAALNPAFGLSLLEVAAWNLLHALPPENEEQSALAVAAVRPEQVAAVARQACDSLLAMVPNRLGPDWAPWSEAVARASHPPLYGRVFPTLHQDRRRGEKLVLAAGGLTLRDGDDHLTMPLPNTVGVLKWDDGGRVLVDTEGNWTRVEPTLWVDGAQLVTELDRIWPTELGIEMGARPNADVPHPAPAPAPPQRPKPAPLTDSARWNLFARRYGISIAILTVSLPLLAIGDPTQRPFLLLATSMALGRIWVRWRAGQRHAQRTGQSTGLDLAGWISRIRTRARPRTEQEPTERPPSAVTDGPTVTSSSPSRTAADAGT